MKHLAKSNKKLNRTSSHRRAMLANMAVSLLKHGRISTTLPKAKALRPYVERIITLGRNADLSAKRAVISKLRDVETSKKLYDEISPKYLNRNGGYTRILKTGFRFGDAAPTAIIELVE